MNNSNSKFKWHYLIIASIMLGILASFFVVGASAEEGTFVAEPTYDDGLYIVGYSSDYSYPENWFVSLVNAEVFIINNPIYTGVDTIRIEPIHLRYVVNDGLYFTYSSYNAENESCDILTSRFEPYYALYGYFYEQLLDSLNYSYLLNSTEYSYPLTIGSSYSLRDITNDCFSAYHDYLSMSVSCSVYSSINNTYYGTFDYFQYHADTGYIFFHNTSDERVLSLHYLDAFYITIEGPSGVSYIQDIPLFSYFFLPYIPTETPIANPFTSIADFVTDFISTIIDGLGSLEFYPGVSLLTLLYCFVGILLVRYLLKLIAGG